VFIMCDERWCSSCKDSIKHEDGEPYMTHRDIILCSRCYIEMIPDIYSMAGFGDGGLIHVIFYDMLHSSKNIRVRQQIRQQIRNYKNILKELLYKYKFSCVNCQCNDVKKLTIDHIFPVSKGGSDDISNLQIMCKSCNSKKGNKTDA